MKFNKKYVLRIDSNSGGTLTIKPPFTVSFDIQRNILSSANVASISIYNLSENTRNKIRKDQRDFNLLKQIILDAGYDDKLALLLNANVTQAYSMRQGTDTITTISAFDGGLAYSNARINKPYPSGTGKREIVLDMVKSLEKYGVSVGKIGNIKGEVSSRGNSYSGNTVDIIRDLTGGSFYVDNGKAYVLSNDEFSDEKAIVINSESGLLGTPRREQSSIFFDMLFEPMLSIGQKVNLQSQTNKNYNGVYKVVSIHHRGMISEVTSGESVTTVGMVFGTGKQLFTKGL